MQRMDGVLNDEQHLAEMMSLIGNPPPEFLRRSKICASFFGDAGELCPVEAYFANIN